MTAGEFVDGVAIGQLSPGPVVMTTAIVGYKLMLDTGDGVVAIAVLGALVGAILGATVTLASESFVDVLTVVLATVTSVLFVRGIDAVYLIFGGGAVGIGAFFLL